MKTNDNGNLVELEQQSLSVVCKEDLLVDYERWIRQQGFSASSPKDHLSKLNLFWQFLEGEQLLVDGNLDLPAIDRDVLAAYQAYIFNYVSPKTKQKLKCNTQINALSYLCTFFRFLEKTKRIALNPADIIKLPKHPHLLPPVLLTPSETRRILSMPDVETALGFRDRTITSHCFRHMLASEMLKGGADLRHIQQMLGHESLATTQRYLHVVKAELKRVHRKTHPKEQLPATRVAYDGEEEWS